MDTYEMLFGKRKTLVGALNEGAKLITGVVAWKKLPPDYEYEWDRIQRRREEEDPLMKGGNYREVDSCTNLGCLMFPYGKGIQKEGYEKPYIERYKK